MSMTSVFTVVTASQCPPGLLVSNKDDMIVCSFILHYTTYALKAELDQICEELHIGGLMWTEREAGSPMAVFCDEEPAVKLIAA